MDFFVEKHFSKLKLISIALLLLILSAAYAPIGIVFARYKVWLNVIELLHNQEFLNAFKFTIFQATLSALFSLIFGVIFGFSILFL